LQRPIPARGSELASFEISLLALSTIKGLGRKGLTTLARTFRQELWRVWEEPEDQLRATLATSKIPSSGAIAEEITWTS
jgi:nucleotidyltransferase/DNA polymerase involved in DNA repair